MMADSAVMDGVSRIVPLGQAEGPENGGGVGRGEHPVEAEGRDDVLDVSCGDDAQHLSVRH